MPLHRRPSPVHAPSMAVVIPNHNGRHLLNECLAALYADLESVGKHEVIVVDNASSDGSVEWLASHWPEVKTVRLEQNRGFAGACNVGAASCAAPIVVFHNNDAVVSPGWSTALRRVLTSDEEVVIAGGLTLFLDRPAVVNSAGMRFALSAAAIDRGFGLPLAQLELRETDVPGVSGVSMAVERDWFHAAGGFDESFFMYFEDADLCLRAWMAGKRIRFTPEAVVLHAFGATSGDRHASLRHYYGSRNRLLTAAKTFGPVRLAVAVVLSFAEDAIVVMWLLARGRTALAGAAARGKLRGALAGLQAFPRYIAGPRRAVVRRRSVGELRALGVIDPLFVSLREFVRMRAVGRRG